MCEWWRNVLEMQARPPGYQVRNVVGRACNPRFGVSRPKPWDRRITCLQEAYWTPKWTLTGGGEKIWITSPSVMEDTDEYIRPQVLIELGGRNVNDAMSPSARAHL